MTTENQNTGPIDTVYYPYARRLKIDIWKNQGENGAFLSPSIARLPDFMRIKTVI